ncbi:hypothetical protein Hypma_004063 [Hypsizygus marmoreus]|uniref:Uncharacterized protein n=1 Tax=Hypsizygus marmoreus TaxID=39966 RepID=A0A369J371_HYPMA|nr:hypothetical protein Hypma_004063 [Hypsizygus marmoreus]
MDFVESLSTVSCYAGNSDGDSTACRDLKKNTPIVTWSILSLVAGQSVSAVLRDPRASGHPWHAATLL